MPATKNYSKPGGEELHIGGKLIIDESGELINNGSGGGASDYTELENKPSINGVTLSGNKSASDLGLDVEPLAVTYQFNTDTYDTSCDTEFSDIFEAISSGNRVDVVLEVYEGEEEPSRVQTTRLYLETTSKNDQDQDVILFQSLFDSSRGVDYQIIHDPTVVSGTSGHFDAGSVVYVHYDEDLSGDNPVYTCNYTFEEIVSHISDGNIVKAIIPGSILSFDVDFTLDLGASNNLLLMFGKTVVYSPDGTAVRVKSVNIMHAASDTITVDVVDKALTVT